MIQAEIFQEYRSELFGIAYRMLGSASEAEDVLQDAYVRYAVSSPEVLHSPHGYFRTIVTRLSLDHLKSARTTREQYIGPWLPEPVLTVDNIDFQQAAEMHEAINMAFLVLLETLTPQERAVFILHEVLEYEHTEIAQTLSLSIANCRQILHRAKERIAQGKARFHPSSQHQREIAECFVEGVESGDLVQLIAFLAHDITFTSDGGGKVTAARKPLLGRPAVIKMLRSIALTTRQLTQHSPGIIRPLVASVNGEAAVLAWIGEQLETVFVLSINGEKITTIWAIRNPDKLKYIREQVLRHENTFPG